MTTKKVSEFTAQSEALAAGDLVGVVDVSDTSQAASGTTKKATLTQIATYTDAQGLATHLADTADAHDASAISNVAAGNIVATTVQAAIDELDSEKLGTTAHDSTDHSSAMSTVVLDDLSDVTITAAASGDLLRWNGSAWVDYADSAYATSGHDHTGTYQPLDADLTAIAAISPSQGDIIYHNGTAWVRLAAGTSGQFLKTQGAAANPAWEPLPMAGNAVGNSLTYCGIPGAAIISGNTVLPLTASTVYYGMFIVNAPITLTSMLIHAHAASSTGGATCRLAIYAADENWQPQANGLMVDAGTVSVTSTGVKRVTGLSTVLPPGRYLSRVHSDASASQASLGYFSTVIPGSPQRLAAPQDTPVYLYRSVTYGAAESSPDPWNAVSLVAHSAGTTAGTVRSLTLMTWSVI